MPVEMFPVIFAIGRMPGWIANYKEIMEDPKSRICRPRQVYTGPTLQPLCADGRAEMSFRSILFTMGAAPRLFGQFLLRFGTQVAMKKILVIDDEEWLREIIQLALQQRGFEVRGRQWRGRHRIGAQGIARPHSLRHQHGQGGRLPDALLAAQRGAHRRHSFSS